MIATRRPVSIARAASTTILIEAWMHEKDNALTKVILWLIRKILLEYLQQCTANPSAFGVSFESKVVRTHEATA